jgi:hypothetical protein
MTKHTVEFLTIERFIATETIPEKALRRKGTDVWRVRKEPVTFSDEDEDPRVWALNRDSELIRIPLIPYRTSSQDFSELVVAAMDVMARCLVQVPNPKRIHIVVGKPVEDRRPEAEAFCFWVGLAFQIG